MFLFLLESQVSQNVDIFSSHLNGRGNQLSASGVLQEPQVLGMEFFGCNSGETDSCKFFKFWALGTKKSSPSASLKKGNTIQNYFASKSGI